MRYLVVFVCALFYTAFVFSQAGGTDCTNLEPICTDVGISFTASSGVPDASTTNPGNNYDCLFSEPNPTYYYLEISTTGGIQMDLSANQDIDFIIWGPFSSLADAEANCGSYSQVVDCSYSSTNNETPEITGAVVGEVYVMLVTNYANVVQDISLTQSGGTGNTDCTIVNPPDPPEPNCPEYASVSSSSTEVCGGQLYYLEVPNIGCNGLVSFNVVGNYGSSFGSEITWEVVSSQTGNIVASGGPGTNGGAINTSVGPFDPATEGTVFNLIVYDSWGDGFNGTGGGIQIQSNTGEILAEINGNFGAEANNYFTSSMDISYATIEVTTPSGVVSNTMNNCQDFSVELTLDNPNFCNTISIDLPWQITCDDGTLISSGTHSVTVYPQVPTQASDVVSITWNAAACSWETSPNNDCDLLDIGSIFTVSPDTSLISPYCEDGTETFTVDYLGLASGPNCCLSSGPLTPITYNTSIDQSSFVAATAYGGINNSAYGTIPPNGIGGNSTNVTIDVSGTGYCCPNCPENPEPYYIDVYVDGVQVMFQGPITVSNFSYTISLADLSSAGVTYTQNSVVEVYVLPNTFYTMDPFTGIPLVYTTYIPGGNCASLSEGQWTMGALNASVSVEFEQQTTSPGICTFTLDENYTCCSPIMVLPPNDGTTVDCSLDITTPSPPTIFDNCGVEIIPSMTESATPPCTGEKVFTYTYTDCSGATVEWNYTYTINENIPPTATNPGDINISIAPAPAPDIAVIIDAADNCSTNPIVAFVSDLSDGNTCPETITRTYSVTDDCGNETLVTQLIIINGSPLDSPTVLANGPICEGSDAVFTITGIDGATVTYDLGDGPNSVVLVGGSATVTVSEVTTNTTINLISISEGSCTSSISISATTEVTSPVIDIINNSGTTVLTCTLEEINLEASGGDNYIWDNGLGNTSQVIINSPGNYSVTGYDSNGCESSAEIEITQENDVDIFAALSVNEICTGEEAVINLTSTNATSFDWSVNQVGVTGASDGSGVNGPSGLDIIQILSVTGSTPGTVEYTITPSLGICTGEPQTITITVNALADPIFAQLGPYCVNDFITDNLNTLSENGITGSWNPSIINVDVVGTTSYSYTPEVGECASSTSMDIVVNDIPEVNFSGDLLEGCAPLEVTLSSVVPGDLLWTVSNGAVMTGSTTTTTFTNSGCYDVTLTVEENGCSNSSTVIDYICVETNPIAQFSVFPQSFTDVNQIIDFTNNSQGATNYFWDFGDSNTSIEENPNHLYEQTEDGIYVTLTAINDFGCTDSISIVIPFDEPEIFYVPNTFTPDGDNFNQVFSPVFYSGFDPFNFEMLIFNRWGEIVFETHNTEIGWDGSYSDQAGVVSDGMYTWKITYKNPKTDERKILIGHVLVLR